MGKAIQFTIRYRSRGESTMSHHAPLHELTVPKVLCRNSRSFQRTSLTSISRFRHPRRRESNTNLEPMVSRTRIPRTLPRTSRSSVSPKELTRTLRLQSYLNRLQRGRHLSSGHLIPSDQLTTSATRSARLCKMGSRPSNSSRRDCGSVKSWLIWTTRTESSVKAFAWEHRSQRLTTTTRSIVPASETKSKTDHHSPKRPTKS